MKKLLVIEWLAVCLVLMTACSKDEIISSATENDNAIGFDPYAGRPSVTRGAGETTVAALEGSKNNTDGGFGVFAYLTGEGTEKTWAKVGASTAPSFMYNQWVKNDQNVWKYEPQKYWPTLETQISFFAYAPYIASSPLKGMTLSESGVNGLPKITYTLPNTTQEMIDIVTAQAIDKTRGNGSAEQAKVNFTFQHILSRVGFQAKTNISSDPNTKINLTAASMTIAEGSGLHKTATYTFANTDGGTGTWTYALEGVLPASYGLALPGELNGKDNSTTTTGYTTSGVLLTGEAADFLKATSPADTYMYLIPTDDNTNSGNIAGAKFEFSFTYDIVTKQLPAGKWAATSTVTKKIDLSKATLNLNPGTAYNIVFEIGLQAIDFGVTKVEGWGTPTNVNADGTSAQ